MVPHLDATAASSSGGGAGPAFVISLLGINDKMGSNRGNDKRLHCSCHGDGTRRAFAVGLLGADNKRWGNRGVVAVAGWQWWQRRPGVCCRPAWRQGRGLEDKRGSRSATGGNRRAQPACTPGRCAIKICAMVFGDRFTGSSSIVSLFPCDKHVWVSYHESITHKICQFFCSACAGPEQQGRGRVTGYPLNMSILAVKVSNFACMWCVVWGCINYKVRRVVKRLA